MICPFCKKDKPRDEFGSAPLPKYEHWCKACNANRASIRKHGVTGPEKARIAQWQCGCAICGHIDPGAKGWTVDHDHACCDDIQSCPKCRRGILCGWCNKMLGAAFDRVEILQSAIRYLEAHAPGTCDWHRPLACSKRRCGKEVAA